MFESVMWDEYNLSHCIKMLRMVSFLFVKEWYTNTTTKEILKKVSYMKIIIMHISKDRLHGMHFAMAT